MLTMVHVLGNKVLLSRKFLRRTFQTHTKVRSHKYEIKGATCSRKQTSSCFYYLELFPSSQKRFFECELKTLVHLVLAHRNVSVAKMAVLTFWWNYAMILNYYVLNMLNNWNDSYNPWAIMNNFKRFSNSCFNRKIMNDNTRDWFKLFQAMSKHENINSATIYKLGLIFGTNV